MMSFNEKQQKEIPLFQNMKLYMKSLNYSSEGLNIKDHQTEITLHIPHLEARRLLVRFFYPYFVTQETGDMSRRDYLSVKDVFEKKYFAARYRI